MNPSETKLHNYIMVSSCCGKLGTDKTGPWSHMQQQFYSTWYGPLTLPMGLLLLVV